MSKEFRFEDLPALPFEAFGGELDNLITSAKNKLEREWPRVWKDVPEASSMLHSLVTVNENTYRAVRFLTADEKLRGRRLAFGVAVGPLVRSILDSLYTVVFLFEDLPARSRWFMRAGWREVAEESQRYSGRYANDEGWQDWLGGFEDFVNRMGVDLGITQDEASNLKSILYWPHPGQMRRHEETSEERRLYMDYLYDWFYKTLSQESHLSWPGLARRAHDVFESSPDVLRKAKSDAVAVAATLMLAIVSELELEIGWGLRDRLLYVWGVLSPFMGFTDEVFRYRYEARL